MDTIVISMNGQTDLLEVIGAFDARGRFADFLNRWKQKPNQHGNDRNHN